MEYLTKKSSKENLIETLDPLVKEWFFSKFRDFSEPQYYAVEQIHKRKNILISAPTGGTKTLTAFLSIINYLIKLAKSEQLDDKVYCVYISPLKALNNDIFVNLEMPLKEICEIAEKEKVKLKKIRVEVRTGDTTTQKKQKMLKNPPHILITTPESLGIILNSVKFNELLKQVEFVIVDEIHSLAENKRGTHLSLSIERLQEQNILEFTRIGLSATISPLDEISKYLVGMKNYHLKEFRECLICEVLFDKKIELSLKKPVKDFIETDADTISKELYDLLDDLIQKHKTTLIFTNTRSATERVVSHLKERFPQKYENLIGAHHSSLSKSHRFEIESKLREGKLKVVVCSTSLELGIDIGNIDLVILLTSPKSVARAIQRIGRAGHRLHETARGCFIVMDYDDAVECAIMVKNIIERKIDRIKIPKNCLDVLSQQIYGMAIAKVWNIDEMYNTIKRSYTFSELSKSDFLSVISYLAGKYYGLEERSVYAKIWYDEKEKTIGKRGKLARMIYMMNIGTIPEESFVEVVAASPYEKRGEKIGQLDESFLERLKKGDVFVLGGSKYEFLYSRGMKVYVNASVKRAPTIPSWFSEQLPLSFDTALSIQEFRKIMANMIDKDEKKKVIEFLKEYLYTNQEIAELIYNYFKIQADFCEIPHLNKILIEHYTQNDGKHFIFFHTLFGRKVNDVLSRAIAYLTGIKSKSNIEIGINDNGFFIASYHKINIDQILNIVQNEDLEKILKEALEKTEVFNRRFRHCASRSLMIIRNYKGRAKSVGKQQMKSGFLLGAVRKISSDFPILRETRREILEDVMDMENAKKVISWIKEGKIKLKVVHTKVPSPFTHKILTDSYVDLVKVQSKIEFLKRMYDKIKNEIK